MIENHIPFESLIATMFIRQRPIVLNSVNDGLCYHLVCVAFLCRWYCLRRIFIRQTQQWPTIVIVGVGFRPVQRNLVKEEIPPEMWASALLAYGWGCGVWT